jgi:hypothetical protein
VQSTCKTTITCPQWCLLVNTEFNVVIADCRSWQGKNQHCRAAVLAKHFWNNMLRQKKSCRQSRKAQGFTAKIPKVSHHGWPQTYGPPWCELNKKTGKTISGNICMASEHVYAYIQAGFGSQIMKQNLHGRLAIEWCTETKRMPDRRSITDRTRKKT